MNGFNEFYKIIHFGKESYFINQNTKQGQQFHT